MHIHNIDLHYHAGQERAEGVSLADHLNHARLTGRKILGITDHLGRYLSPKREGRHYQASAGGLLQYRAEMDALKADFNDLTLYFAPEISPGQNLEEVPAEVIEASDFFIGEADYPGESVERNTRSMVQRMGELRELSDATGREVFLAHPFRSAVNMRLIKRDPEPRVSALAPRWHGRFDLDEIADFFLLDIEAMADASKRFRIPLEINGNTQFRIRSSNLPAPLQMLWCALRTMRDRGAEFVPGSDQHGFMAGIGRIGGAVPADCFHALGIGAADIAFLGRIAQTVDRVPAKNE